jgi:galactokinase
MGIAVTQRAEQLFLNAFNAASEFAGSAPGRVELLGNHTDYNGGFVLTAAVDIRTAVVLRRSSDGATRIVTELSGHEAAHIDLAKGPAQLTDSNRWCGYIAGVLDYFSPSGSTWEVAVASDVPDGSGISSSAAVLVATASAVLPALEISLSPMEIAVACRAVENGPWVGAPVGLLDQFSSACGEQGMALYLDCKTFEWTRVPLSSECLGILIVNTNVKHALSDGGGYTTRRAECEAAAMQLSKGRTTLLRDVTAAEFSNGISNVEQPSQNRARHVWNENNRVLLGTDCLINGDVIGFGATLNASHASCRGLFENTCAEIDKVQQILEGTQGVFGAKLSGGGWGGSVVALVDPSMIHDIVNHVVTQYGDGLTILSTYAASGARGGRA